THPRWPLLWAASVPLLLGVSCGRTALPPVGDRIQALIDGYKQQQEEFSRRYSQAKSDKEKEQIAQTYPQPTQTAKALLEIVKAAPADAAIRPALHWLVDNGRGNDGKGPSPATQAKMTILEHHLDDPQISKIFFALSQDSLAPESEQILRGVSERKATPELRGRALHALANLYKNQAESVEAVRRAHADGSKRSQSPSEESQVKRWMAMDPTGLRAQADSLWEQLTTDNELGSVEISYGPRKVTLRELAERNLFELRELQAGLVAPDIEGEDLEGEPLKLSDYRGSVVVLDFWGDW
ncbi:MAG TPA: hypothetical protein VIY86_11845, partial [Pirellulaceae bacterium]